MLKILIASRNRGKIRELHTLLKEHVPDTELELLSLDDVGFAGEIEENGTTFEENALIKARAGAEFSGLITVADDSGLCVKALGNGPGVYSARYSGGDDNDNNEKLLRELKGVADRTAAYVCCMACVFPEGAKLEGEPIVVFGDVVGEILYDYRGEGGFGYDPLFWYDDLGKTFAEITAEEKNAISHRGKAVAKLGAALEARIADKKEALWKDYIK